jgi:anti-anti-sigma factor
MSRCKHDDGRDDARTATEFIPSHDGAGTSWESLPDDGTPPRLQMQVIERTAIVRFLNSETLFEEAAVHTVGRELRRLIEDEGHTRLVMNFTGVQYLSTEVLAILAVLQRKVDPARGSIVLCGLDPLLRDMVRITHLDRVFDICGDEAEALGLKPR